MIDPIELENAFDRFMSDLPKYLPEGLFEVDLDLLQRLNLFTEAQPTDQEYLNDSFFVMEASDKLTLFNQKYVIWIFPELVNSEAATCALIAMNEKNLPKLETGFVTMGLFNNSALVLQILERFLEEIDDNEKEIRSWS